MANDLYARTRAAIERQEADDLYSHDPAAVARSLNGWREILQLHKLCGNECYVLQVIARAVGAVEEGTQP